MKSTMNSRDIAKFHKLLDKDMPHKTIVKILGVDLETLKKFTPEKVAVARDAKKKAIAESNIQRKKTQEIAAATLHAARSAMDG